MDILGDLVEEVLGGDDAPDEVYVLVKGDVLMYSAADFERLSMEQARFSAEEQEAMSIAGPVPWLT